MPRLLRYGWFVLLFNVGVIILGARVRATGSGAGCGETWPTCHGQLIPQLADETAVEYVHRSASGVAIVLVFVLALWVWRSSPARAPVRKAVLVAALAIIGEALIGAMIVLARWVAHDDSVARAVAVPLHLVNTFLLLGALTLTIHFLRGGRSLDFASNSALARWLTIGGVAIVLISATGAITALADTLFPKDGIGLDLEAGSHFLTRLRVIHPILAVGTAVIAWWKVGGRVRGGDAAPVVWLVGAMLVTGAANITLGVPVWMQLVHLALADALWIAYVLMAARALQSAPARSDSLVTE